MDFKRTAITVAVALFSVTSVFCQRDVTSQADVDLIANYLDVKVHMQPQLFSSGDFVVQIVFNNTATERMLQKKDWSIQFSVKQKLFPAKPMHVDSGLVVQRSTGCNYVISAGPKAKRPFQGLNAREHIVLTIPGKGLSVFKYDVYTNWIFHGGEGTVAKTIRSTASDDLDFVYYRDRSDSKSDSRPALVDGFMRGVMMQEARDLNGVPESTVMPPSKSVFVDRTQPMKIINLTESTWIIWPNARVSDVFVERLKASLLSLPGMAGRVQVFRSTPQQKNPPSGTGIAYVYVVYEEKEGATKDYYTLVGGQQGATEFIHMTAFTEEGFANALSSLESVYGLFPILPHFRVQDDARFGTRSVFLDVTSNFFGKATILKFLKLMRMFKLNDLVMKLADDSGWRLETPQAMDFNELFTYASQRCADASKCLPPIFGSGADNTTSGSGYYSTADFVEILREAEKMRISVTPLINFMGGMKAAKAAAHKRYMRLLQTNKTEADRLHIMSPNYPTISEAEKSKDACYTDGVLDPCNQPTYNFIKDTIAIIYKLYDSLNIPLKQFHAGGDDTTAYLHKFGNCKDPLRRMLSMIKSSLRNVTRLRVNEEAVTDPATGYCLSALGSYRPADITVDFLNIAPTAHDTWGLTKAQFDYLNSTVLPPVNMTMVDPLKPYNHGKVGNAPWGKAYECANMDYKCILGPKQFFDLSSAYELDFHEVGSRGSDELVISNMHRMLTFEPFNYYASMDMGVDRYRHIPYRLTKLFNCPRLKPDKKANIIGLRASIDTSVLRTEAKLWHVTTPRIAQFSVRAWRQGMHENILDPNDENTLKNISNVQLRSGYLEYEIGQFLNILIYKTLGRLDDAGYPYRVTRPGYSIYFGIAFYQPDPWPVAVKLDWPALELMQYRIKTTPPGPWKTLFWKEERTGALLGGYNVSMPLSGQPDIEIRLQSVDRTRSSIPTTVLMSMNTVFPQLIPVDLRKGTCLPVMNPEQMEITDVTDTEWRRIISNIPTVGQEQMTFANERFQKLENAFQTQRARSQRSRSRSRAAWAVGRPGEPQSAQEAMMALEQMVMTGTNVAALPSDNIYRVLFETEQKIMQDREKTLKDRLNTMHNEYLACSRNKGKKPGKGKA